MTTEVCTMPGPLQRLQGELESSSSFGPFQLPEESTHTPGLVTSSHLISQQPQLSCHCLHTPPSLFLTLASFLPLTGISEWSGYGPTTKHRWHLVTATCHVGPWRSGHRDVWGEVVCGPSC